MDQRQTAGTSKIPPVLHTSPCCAAFPKCSIHVGLHRCIRWDRTVSNQGWPGIDNGYPGICQHRTGSGATLQTLSFHRTKAEAHTRIANSCSKSSAKVAMSYSRRHGCNELARNPAQVRLEKSPRRPLPGSVWPSMRLEPARRNPSNSSSRRLLPAQREWTVQTSTHRCQCNRQKQRSSTDPRVWHRFLA